MSLRIRRTVLPPLFGGVNNNPHRFAVEKDEAWKIENCHLDSKGVASTRGGSTLINTTALDGAVTSIHELVMLSGSSIVRTVLVSAGLAWYVWDGEGTTTCSKIKDLNTKDKPSIVTVDYGGATYAVLANGVDFLKYDGSTVTNLLSLASDFPSSGIPKYLQVYNTRLVAGGMITEPTRVRLSNPTDPTTWDANDFFTFEDDGNLEVVTGIGTMYDFLVTTKKNQIIINNESDPTSTTVKQIPVSKNIGSASHWGMQTVGSRLFFENSSGFFVGELREALEDGMVVSKIGANVENQFSQVQSFSSIDSVYDAAHKELLWGVQQRNYDKPNLALVFNLDLSNFTNGDYVWSGWNRGDGYDPLTFGTVTSSSGKKEVWRGDSNGFVYRMDARESYKDEVGGSTDVDINTYIHLPPFIPSGLSIVKRFLDATAALYQNTNGSTTLSWIVDSSYLNPGVDGRVIEVDGHVPFWNDCVDGDYTEGWGTTIWIEKPILPAIVDVKQTGKFIEFIINNTGVNARDEISYHGLEIAYQVLGRKR